MEWFEKLKEKLGIGQCGGKAEIRQLKKVTRGDIQENIARIQVRMRILEKEITEITDEMHKLDMNNESDACRYDELKKLLEDKNNIYSAFQKQIEINYTNLKKMSEAGRSDTVLKYVMVVGGIFLSVIGLGLNRESPSILKIIDFILKPFRTPLKF